MGVLPATNGLSLADSVYHITQLGSQRFLREAWKICTNELHMAS